MRCVETVSLGNIALSTTRTLWPCRARSIAVGDPAHRAPTTIASYGTSPPPLFRLPSNFLPRCHSRNPPWHFRSVALLVRSAAPFEPRLLDHHKVHVIEREEDDEPPSDRPRPVKECLAREHRGDAGDHGVSHVAVRPRRNETLCRIPRSKRALPFYREESDA